MGRSPSDPYLLLLRSAEACREEIAACGVGAILASWCPAVAPCPKYSVMSGGGTEEEWVACPLGSGSLFLRGLPMVSGGEVQVPALCRQAGVGASVKHVCSGSHPNHAPGEIFYCLYVFIVCGALPRQYRHFGVCCCQKVITHTRWKVWIIF